MEALTLLAQMAGPIYLEIGLLLEHDVAGTTEQHENSGQVNYAALANLGKNLFTFGAKSEILTMNDRIGRHLCSLGLQGSPAQLSPAQRET